jgi:Flp pilus assembly protein TadD
LLCDYGYNCYLQRRWAEAEAHLRKALELDPNLGRAHTNLGLVLARNGREAEALREFRHAGCREGPARTNLGFALMSESRWDEARHQFQLALKVDPTLTAAQEGLTTLQAVAGNLDFSSSGHPRG